MNSPLIVEAAARLANQVTLRDISCVEVRAVHLNAPPDSPDLALSWSTPSPSVFWGLEGAVLKVLIPFVLVIEGIEPNGDAKALPLAEIRVTLRLDYDVRGENIQQDLPHFAGISSYMHAWPYFRADVQALTTKLGFPPLVLPVIVCGHPAKHVTVRTFEELKHLAAPPRRRKRSKVGS